MAREIYDFLTNYSVGGPPRYYLSLPTLWKVEFSGTGSIVGQIDQALEKAGEAWRVKSTPDDFMANGNTMVAREITVPGETTEFLEAGGDINKGGFLPAFGVSKRQGFLTRTMSVNIFDTNDDLEHNFFRPWMIAVGIDGLINRGLLCPNVILRQYNHRGELRKGYNFTDVFPTNVEGYTLNYDNETFLEKSVTFAFKNYAPLSDTSNASFKSTARLTGPLPASADPDDDAGTSGGEIRKFRGSAMFPVNSDIRINPDGSKEVIRRSYIR